MRSERWLLAAVLVGACSQPSDGDPPLGQESSTSTTAGGSNTQGETGESTSESGTTRGSPPGEASTAADPSSVSTVDETAGESTTTGGAELLCDPAVSLSNREIVATAIDELFVQKDLGAIDRYWSDPYLQHNPIAQSGVAAFRSIMSSFVPTPSFQYQRLRTLGECDLVVVQGQYSQTGVIFDMFRVSDEGKIIEHWDSDSNQASETGGPTEITDPGSTAENREHVIAFLTAVLIDGQHDRVAEFLAPAYEEHRTTTATGPDALLEYVDRDAITYVEIHHVIADGNFVFTLSEGQRQGAAFGFYDLFRLENGSIVEHWDSRRSVPNSTASGLPIF